jgi:hypothetical protein
MHPDLDPERPLARLMRELPDALARPYDFGEFQHRARRRAAARSTVRGHRALAAAAAVLAVGTAALYLRLAGPRAALLRPATEAPAAAAAQAPPAGADVMEHWLASLPSDPALVRVGSRAAVMGLEDRIAQVDDLLSAARAEPAHPARLSTLQEQRARLVGALVQVRYAETLADAAR